MRLLAGKDDQFDGHITRAPGITVAHLDQVRPVQCTKRHVTLLLWRCRLSCSPPHSSDPGRTLFTQEPALDDGPTVDDNIRPAMEKVQSMLTEFEQVGLAGS
jgi:hypothetical protein